MAFYLSHGGDAKEEKIQRSLDRVIFSRRDKWWNWIRRNWFQETKKQE